MIQNYEKKPLHNATASKITRNGVILAQTVVQSPTTKKYTFTVTANTAADVVTARIKNTVLTPLGTLYKSNTATAVVV